MKTLRRFAGVLRPVVGRGLTVTEPLSDHDALAVRFGRAVTAE